MPTLERCQTASKRKRFHLADQAPLIRQRETAGVGRACVIGLHGCADRLSTVGGFECAGFDPTGMSIELATVTAS